MAKYYIMHTCGHGHEHVLFGKNTDRERILKSAERSECPDCDRASRIADAKAHAVQEGLPELTGTEKQIAWAEQIRKQKFSELKALAKSVKKMKPINEDAQRILDWMLLRVQDMIHTPEAAWWIEVRDDEMSRGRLMKEAKAWAIQQGMKLGGGEKP